MDVELSWSGHTSGVTDGQFGRHPLSTLAVTTGKEKSIALHSLEGEPVQTISTSSVPQCVMIDMEESCVAFGTVTGLVRIYSMQQEKLASSLTGHSSIVTGIAQCPTSTCLWATACLDHFIRLFDMRAGCKPVTVFTSHTSPLHRLAWSPHGQWLVSGGESGAVKLHCLQSSTPLASLDAHINAVTDVLFHPHEFLLATASADKTVRFWDGETFECVSQSPQLPSTPERLMFHPMPHTKCLFAASSNSVTACTWEPYEVYGRANVIAEGTVLDMKIDQNSLRLLTVDSDNTVNVVRQEITHDAPHLVGCGPETSTPALPSASPLQRNRMRRSFHEKVVFADDPVLDESSPSSSATTPATEHSETWSSESSPTHEIARLLGEGDVFRTREMLDRSPPPPITNIGHVPPARDEGVEDFVVHTVVENPPTRQPSTKKFTAPRTTKPSSTDAKFDKKTTGPPKSAKSTSKISTRKPSHRSSSKSSPSTTSSPSCAESSEPDDPVCEPSVSCLSTFSDSVSLESRVPTLRQRAKCQQLLMRSWRQNGWSYAVGQAVTINDSAVTLDIIAIANRRPELWSLEVLALVIPRMQVFLGGRSDAHTAAIKATLLNVAPNRLHSMEEKAQTCRDYLTLIRDKADLQSKQSTTSVGRRKALQDIAEIVDKLLAIR